MQKYLNMNEAADLLGISKSTLYKKVHLRHLPYYKIGKLIRFKESEIHAWIESKKIREK